VCGPADELGRDVFDGIGDLADQSLIRRSESDGEIRSRCRTRSRRSPGSNSKRAARSRRSTAARRGLLRARQGGRSRAVRIRPAALARAARAERQLPVGAGLGGPSRPRRSPWDAYSSGASAKLATSRSPRRLDDLVVAHGPGRPTDYARTLEALGRITYWQGDFAGSLPAYEVRSPSGARSATGPRSPMPSTPGIHLQHRRKCQGGRANLRPEPRTAAPRGGLAIFADRRPARHRQHPVGTRERPAVQPGLRRGPADVRGRRNAFGPGRPDDGGLVAPMIGTVEVLTVDSRRPRSPFGRWSATSGTRAISPARPSRSRTSRPLPWRPGQGARDPPVGRFPADPGDARDGSGPGQINAAGQRHGSTRSRVTRRPNDGQSSGQDRDEDDPAGRDLHVERRDRRGAAR
jgi:hypothetical protein